MGEMEKEGGMGKDKRLVVLYVLDILRNHSNEKNLLKQKEIIQLLNGICAKIIKSNSIRVFFMSLVYVFYKVNDAFLYNIDIKLQIP